MSRLLCQLSYTALHPERSADVRPDTTTARLEFNQTGPRAGTCFLSCHGTTHSGTNYASGAMAAPALKRGILKPALPPVRKGGSRK